MERIFLDLTYKNTVITDFETSPLKKELGGEDPDIEIDKIRMYIGDKPMAFNIRELYAKTGKTIPEEIELFQSYDAYVLNHYVGLVKEGGFKKVNQVGYQINFNEDEEILVLDVMPQTKFISIIDGKLEFSADVSINGHVSMPEKLTNILKEKVEFIGLGGKLQMSSENSVVGRFSFSVKTPEIMSIGKGSRHSEWIFNQVDNPLYGDDLEMYQIILVDRFIKEISYKVKIYTTVSTFNMLPIRRESKWQELTCKLK